MEIINHQTKSSKFVIKFSCQNVFTKVISNEQNIYIIKLIKKSKIR